jgi:integrase
VACSEHFYLNRNLESGGPRARGEGGIRQRPDGRWEATLYREDGTRQYFYGRTRADVVDKLDAAKDKRRKGLPTDQTRITVTAWLDHWLETVIARNPRVNTRRSYEQAARVHIASALGRYRLAELQPHHVEAWVTRLLASGRAPSTVRRIHAILHIELEHALRQGYVQRNVAGLVTPVRVDKADVHPLGRDDARRLLEAAATHRDAAMYALVLAYGLRKGELLGLTWDDVDLDGRELHIRQQVQRRQVAALKRGASRRVLRLRPWIVDMLRAHAIRLKERQLLAGQRWRDHGLVFPSDVGTPQGAANLHTAWKRLLRRAGIPDVRFHDLRHTAATLALAEGASLFDVSRMLGHNSIKTTADLYGHWSQEGREDVAQRMERALRGAAV